MDMTELRKEVCHVNKMLPATGLVTMHSGNASECLSINSPIASIRPIATVK